MCLKKLLLVFILALPLSWHQENKAAYEYILAAGTLVSIPLLKAILNCTKNRYIKRERIAQEKLLTELTSLVEQLEKIYLPLAEADDIVTPLLTYANNKITITKSSITAEEEPENKYHYYKVASLISLHRNQLNSLIVKLSEKNKPIPDNLTAKIDIIQKVLKNYSDTLKQSTNYIHESTQVRLSTLEEKVSTLEEIVYLINTKVDVIETTSHFDSTLNTTLSTFAFATALSNRQK